MKLPCHLRAIRGERTLIEISNHSHVPESALSKIERGIDAYGAPVTEWYTPQVLLALTGDDAWNADVRQVLLARAEASHRYAVHLLEVAGGEYLVDVHPRSRPRALGQMIAEHLQIAAGALAALHAKGLA